MFLPGPGASAKQKAAGPGPSGESSDANYTRWAVSVQIPVSAELTLTLGKRFRNNDVLAHRRLLPNVNEQMVPRILKPSQSSQRWSPVNFIKLA